MTIARLVRVKVRDGDRRLSVVANVVGVREARPRRGFPDFTAWATEAEAVTE